MAGVEGVDEATPVWVDPAAKVGDTTVTAVVADPAALGRISLTPAGAQIPGGLLVPTQDGARALAVPAGATGLDIALAGRIIMNPWQELELQLLPELNAEAARLDRVVEPQAPSFEERMAWDLEARRTPIDIATRVSVRDLTTGLGFLLIDGQNTGRADIIVLSIVLLALLGKGTDVLLGLLERRVLRWSDAWQA